MTEQLSAADTATVEPEAEPQAQESHAAAGSSKMFTAEQMDAEIKRRIDKANAKHQAELDAIRAETEAARKLAEDTAKERDALKSASEIREAALAAANEYGVPVDVLRGGNADEIRAHAKQLADSGLVARRYPVIPDSGEKKERSLTKEDIRGIKNKAERKAAIAANIGLFT